MTTQPTIDSKLCDAFRALREAEVMLSFVTFTDRDSGSGLFIQRSIEQASHHVQGAALAAVALGLTASSKITEQTKVDLADVEHHVGEPHRHPTQFCGRMCHDHNGFGYHCHDLNPPPAWGVGPGEMYSDSDNNTGGAK